MKITPEHYDYMLAAITPLTGKLKAFQEKAKADPNFNQSAMRLRWDALWASGISAWLSVNVYPYANDDHIDTALRSIFKEIGI